MLRSHPHHLAVFQIGCLALSTRSSVGIARSTTLGIQATILRVEWLDIARMLVACSVLNKLQNQQSTACSRHFIKHIGISHPDGPPYGSLFRSRDVRCMMEPSIIRYFNGIGAMKSFGKRRCLLCNEE